MSAPKQPDDNRLDRIVRDARRDSEERDRGYREQALRMYPWICGRCGREFTRENLRELTVHHRDHNHDNNPADGSNWELLCLYCHDNEHARQLEATGVVAGKGDEGSAMTQRPFAALGDLFKK
ncbi:MAG: YajD family HNH nuclease [Gammaproteobacteria bacterium]|nr:YajD family HNH nuclease [Gammaproteobacteria bacterium]